MSKRYEMPRRLALATLILLGSGGVALLSFVTWQEDEEGAQSAAREEGAQTAARVEEHEHAREPLPSKSEIAELPPDGGEELNRLVFESSPYLLQHARNPVDWYSWGEEAFEKARREGKPVFLSIGYSTCHWCHVMERESFESEAVAEIMNEHFVSIKVDREERPDVDTIYMTAVQTMTGSGGWPMSVFLTPDRKPFFGGTYFPPEDRLGRPGFKSLLTRIADAWGSQREQLLQGADQLTVHIQSQASGGGSAEIGVKTLEQASELYAGRIDRTYGGFGPAPKFPRSHSLSFLLRYYERSGDANALAMVETTLDQMARGGVYDHVGGGFHRYSTDRTWLVPHFEKMLYDQALIARTYLEAFQVTGNESYAGVARGIFTYVLRDMTGPGGGFYSAEDADSEGVEGKFYVWTRQELLDVLGKEDGQLFAQTYGVDEAGNYREEGGGEATGQNILHLPKLIPEVAGELDLDVATLEKRIAAMRTNLFAVRERRIHPHKDDKILADWNGLMIGALAYGGRVLDEPLYLEAARKAADFVITTMEEDGRLLHSYRAGQASIEAFLDDYAFLSLALLDLYEATFEVRWLRESKHLAGEMVRLFWDDAGRGFHLSGSDGERLIARTKQLYDGAIPSGNSAATLALLKLGRLTMDEPFEKLAQENLEFFSAKIHRFPMGFPFMLIALDFAVGPTKEVVLAGNADSEGIRSMHAEINRRFLPRLVLAHHPMGTEASQIEILVPFLEEQRAVDGEATAYVCENYACNLPTTEVEKMISLIDDR